MRRADELDATVVAHLPVVDAVGKPGLGGVPAAVKFPAADGTDLPMLFPVRQPGLGGVLFAVKFFAADGADLPMLFPVRQPGVGGVFAAGEFLAADGAHLPMLFPVRQPGVGGVLIHGRFRPADGADAAMPLGGGLPGIDVRLGRLADVLIAAVGAGAVALPSRRAGRGRIFHPFAVGVGEGVGVLALRFAADGTGMAAHAVRGAGRGHFLRPAAPAVAEGGDHFIRDAPADGALMAGDALRRAGRVARRRALVPAVLRAVGRLAADGAFAPMLGAVRVPAVVAVPGRGDALRLKGAASLVGAGVPPFARAGAGGFGDGLPFPPVVFGGGDGFGARLAAYEAGVRAHPFLRGSGNGGRHALAPAVLGAVERLAAHGADVPMRLAVRLPLQGGHMARGGDGLCPRLAAGGAGVLQLALAGAGRRAQDDLRRIGMFADGQRARLAFAALAAQARFLARGDAVGLGDDPPVAPVMARRGDDLLLRRGAGRAGVDAQAALRAGGRFYELPFPPGVLGRGQRLGVRGAADGAGVRRLALGVGPGQRRGLPLVPGVGDEVARFAAVKADLPMRGAVAVPVPAVGVSGLFGGLRLRMPAHGAAVLQRALFRAGRVPQDDPFSVCMPERGDLLGVAVAAHEADARLFARLRAVGLARARPFAPGMRRAFGRLVAAVADLPMLRLVLLPGHEMVFVVDVDPARAQDEQHAQPDDDHRRDRQRDGCQPHRVQRLRLALILPVLLIFHSFLLLRAASARMRGTSSAFRQILYHVFGAEARPRRLLRP